MLKKIVYYAYYAFLLLFAILMGYVAMTFSNSVIQQETRDGYEVIEDYSLEMAEDQSAPIGVRQVYTWTVRNVQDAYQTLLFYTKHQNVRVYLNEECIYSIEPDARNLFGKTPGGVWNQVSLTEADNGSRLRIELLPVYESSSDAVPDFYLGTKYDIAVNIFCRSIPAILFGIVAFITGIAFIGFVVYNYKNTEIDKSLVMLGIFAILLGVWKLVDAEAVRFFLPGQIAKSMISSVSLLMVSVPFLLFMKEQQNDRESLLWYIPCFTSLFEMLVVLVLQFTNRMDVRQTLILTHVQLIFLLVVCVYMVFREIRATGWNAKLKRTASGMLLCFVGMLADLAFYYATKGRSMVILALCGFLIYIIVLGMASMKEAKQLMAIGMRAKNYERMAYHDQLTGLYNRTAYAALTGDTEFEPEHCIVVMFDLNDLKKCNDTLGHEKGDLYIKESAHIIQNIFGEAGECYRMGGDEFCVLIKNGSLAKCKQMVDKLKAQVDRFNQSSKDVFMQIACGYELYDKRIDYDIGDTARRADKMMYHEKFSMKQKNGGGEIR
ncbi:MAG: GGDEF domain-containing protein [Acetatifactor sp.]|nr:GGDEF domain-containing protein [Acetatifactor sp.]